MPTDSLERAPSSKWCPFASTFGATTQAEGERTKGCLKEGVRARMGVWDDTLETTLFCQGLIRKGFTFTPPAFLLQRPPPKETRTMCVHSTPVCRGLRTKRCMALDPKPPPNVNTIAAMATIVDQTTLPLIIHATTSTTLHKMKLPPHTIFG